MTSRPAAPESETPEADKVYRAHPICEYEKTAHPSDCAAWLDFARSLERRLSLAQTEIKGYRSRESDLDIGALQRALDEAQARIAELEKLLREVYGEFAKRHILATDLQTRIDAALKDRA